MKDHDDYPQNLYAQYVAKRLRRIQRLAINRAIHRSENATR